MSVDFQRTSRLYTPEDIRTLHNYRCDKPHILHEEQLVRYSLLYELSMICAVVPEECDRQFTVGGNELTTFVMRGSPQGYTLWTLVSRFKVTSHLGNRKRKKSLQLFQYAPPEPFGFT
jgi:hypothetical protein